jgi:threonine aldolase
MAIDLRSDTVTLPTDAMRAAIAAAPVGDDVYGDDPTVRALEERVAALLGEEAGLFTPSGTQANLLAVMAQCGRGDEYLAGRGAHTYQLEGGGAAVLGSVQPQPVLEAAHGGLDLDDLAACIKPDDSHFARSRLVCLENTRDGRVVPLTHHRAVQQVAAAHGLRTHLDGARLWNAAVALGCPPADVAAGFDTTSVSLSKGLGAPVGSVLTGSRATIAEARRWRKALGGGMRQAGFLAAAGLHALDHHLDRLAEDHANARRLADGLRPLPFLDVEWAPGQTNMVWAGLRGDALSFGAWMAAHEVVVTAEPRLRLVTHLGVSAADVDRVVEVAAAWPAAGETA